MKLKNNSGNASCGFCFNRGIYVNIAPFSTFEMPDNESAQQLLALLGSPEWITIVPEAPEEVVVSSNEVIVEKSKKEDIDIEEKPKKITRKLKK